MKRIARCAILALLSTVFNAAAEDTGAPKGVNPKDLVTKVDLIARRDTLNGGFALDSLTFKYDRGLDRHWGMSIEVPLARFSGPGLRVTGIAESKLKFRRVENFDGGAWIAGGEFSLPIESKSELGSGQWQVNPSVGVVWSVTPAVFVFTGYQHFVSVGGRDSAPDVHRSQPRVLAAMTSPAGWWVMSDMKYTWDHETSEKTFDVEVEAGRMVARDWAISLRLIDSGLDTNRRWGALVALRHLF